MANTLNGVNLARLSQLSLDTLLTETLPLRQFVTDFSPEVRASGETVTTRFASNWPSVQDMAASKSPGDVTTTARTVTLNNFDGVVIAFDDLERTYSDIELVDLFVAPAMSTLIEHVTSAALGVITSANGFNATAALAATDMNADAMADLAEALTTQKVPRTGRAAILKPSYYAGLVKDNVIQAVDSSGSSEALRDHRVSRVHGIAPVEYNGNIPAGDANMEGFVGHRNSLCIAARGVNKPAPGTWFGNISDIVDPTSGLPLQIREYYNGSQMVYEWALNFGVSHGVTDSGIIIASA